MATAIVSSHKNKEIASAARKKGTSMDQSGVTMAIMMIGIVVTNRTMYLNRNQYQYSERVALPLMDL